MLRVIARAIPQHPTLLYLVTQPAGCRVLTVNEDLQSVDPERAAELMEERGFVRTWPRGGTSIT